MRTHSAVFDKVLVMFLIFSMLFVGAFSVFSRPLSQDTPGVNDPPDIILPPPPSTFMNLPVAIPGITVTDPDVGSGALELQIYIVDMDGLGGLSVPAGDYGRLSWGYGAGVTDQTFIGTLAEINTGLASFTVIPHPVFNGMIRVAFSIDDLGNTGTGGSQGDVAFFDIVVATVSATPTSTPTGTLTTPTSTSTSVVTNTPSLTPTSTSTSAVTNTATSTSAVTNTATSTSAVTNTATSTSAVTNTPTSTPTGSLTSTPLATNTVVSTVIATSTPTPSPDPACLYPIPLTAVQGRVLISTLAFYDPTLTATTNVLVPSDSAWWIIDARNGFYKIWIACHAEPVWILASNVSPNFDDVWNGASLPNAGD